MCCGAMVILNFTPTYLGKQLSLVEERFQLLQVVKSVDIWLAFFKGP